MTLQQLKYVIAIVEKGSINEAAKVLYLSQPSLTKAIHEFFWELCKFVKTVKIISARDELFTARPDPPNTVNVY